MDELERLRRQKEIFAEMDRMAEQMEAEAIRDGRFLVVEVDEHGVPLDWDPGQPENS